MKKRKFPKNPDCPLNKYEKVGLNKFLDELEWKEYQQVKHQTSGYVESKVTDYNEFDINFQITIGIDGQWSNTTNYTIKRLEILICM
jgi:hypothetical protein